MKVTVMLLPYKAFITESSHQFVSSFTHPHSFPPLAHHGQRVHYLYQACLAVLHNASLHGDHNHAL